MGKYPAIRFHKYQALGNDYLVIHPKPFNELLTIGQIRWLCDRRYGVGADGILLGPLPSKAAPFGLRIFNPDGSEAEKSGNGLRIFARYLWDQGKIQVPEQGKSVENRAEAERLFKSPWIAIETKGGVVEAQVFPSQDLVAVRMGRVSFDSLLVPVAGPRREAVEEILQVQEQVFRYCAAHNRQPSLHYFV